MSIKLRLILMNFLQFFVWGSWLLTIGAYWFQNRHWSGTSFGAIFSTMGIASLFMPSITGIIADKWISAEKLYGLLHIGGAIVLFTLPMAESPTTMFWIMLLNMIFYMPTIALAISVAYNALKDDGRDVVRDYPPIRVWGTIGFIVALWTVSLLHLETSAAQFYVASAASLLLGLYAFTLPKCPPKLGKTQSRLLIDRLGLTSFTLLKNPNMAVFFFFAMLLGAALQLTNAYGDTFLHDFATQPQYQGTIAVRYPAIIMSISQISETLFILAIPFFLRRFGIKTVMVISMLAWFLRFGLLAYGNPGGGLWMIVLSCIVYGMAFDFFNISGSLFVETQSDPKIRASAQGLFMVMTNGIGAVLGSSLSGIIIDRYFTLADQSKDWHGIWLTFAIYALVMAVLFVPLFKHRHDPAAMRSLHADNRLGA
ncbi:MFS transporter [Pseudolysobacter antarcticus]|uniref:MFS transporter n=1 Tax=Pseudolysobacter antarcticus TaxID=2511995 RepID=A0A411HN35_9GAMM|nr:nucleoside permease [Pseudolysobacter antarcticus]QBB71891.1 MFS transporter [Pseudolysobacter antarcticus]